MDDIAVQEKINELLKKDFGVMVCKELGIHNFIPYKPGTMICSRCGIFAKVTATYMRTGDTKYLEVEGKQIEEANNDI